MKIEKIQLIGWICVSVFFLALLGLSIWNAFNHWNTKTDGMDVFELNTQNIVTGLSVVGVIVVAIITAFVLLFGLYGQIEEVYGI